jgi:hypothetical protein
MPEDDYQYQPKPLPQLNPFGGTQSSSASSAPTTPATIDTADNLQTGSPFINDAGQGSYPGAGAEPPLNCTSNVQIGTVNAEVVAFPCTTPTSSISDAGISLTISGGTFDQNTAGGTLVITLGGKTISIDITSLPTGATAQFREFEICAGQTIWVLSTEAV